MLMLKKLIFFRFARRRKYTLAHLVLCIRLTAVRFYLILRSHLMKVRLGKMNNIALQGTFPGVAVPDMWM
ncbi:hypothetical protein CSC3H3_14055 [Thalassospira marina]|uniref:Uncharacterized protein n=1 Tax=Thalassospira marina TaxID=2048283 RepID=A0A2N3KWG9_9PROT|nr:hypothetical protein CSC3H3_14055 [Thalassospira marina]PKR54857.1 hypothetical protein COO20_05480 [Thalassospira marina]